MLLESLSHVITLDFAWFVPLVLNNLLWVFVFAGLGHFIYGKTPIRGAIYICIYLFALTDFTNALGWVYQVGFFWTISLGFIFMTVFDAFFKDTKFGLQRGNVASTMFYVFLLLYHYPQAFQF